MFNPFRAIIKWLDTRDPGDIYDGGMIWRDIWPRSADPRHNHRWFGSGLRERMEEDRIRFAERHGLKY